MHVGHIRSALLGDSLQKIYKFCDDDVTSDVHLGDWGTQMGMLIEEVKLMFPELIYFDENYNGEYPKESPVTVKELAEIYPQASKDVSLISLRWRKQDRLLLSFNRAEKGM